MYNYLQKDDLVTHHEGREHRVDLVRDCLARMFGDMQDCNRGHAAMATMGPHLDGTVDPSFRKRR